MTRIPFLLTLLAMALLGVCSLAPARAADDDDLEVKPFTTKDDIVKEKDGGDTVWLYEKGDITINEKKFKYYGRLDAKGKVIFDITGWETFTAKVGIPETEEDMGDFAETLTIKVDGEKVQQLKMKKGEGPKTITIDLKDKETMSFDGSPHIFFGDPKVSRVAKDEDGGGDDNEKPKTKPKDEPKTGGGTAPAAPAGVRKRLAVMSFEVPESVASGWGDGGTVHHVQAVFADMLITALVKSGSFDVIEREQLEKIMKEKEISADEITKDAKKFGKVLGVDYILGGKITEFGVKDKKIGVGGLIPGTGGDLGLKNSKARAVLDVRLVDVATAKILLAETGTGENSEKGISAEGFHAGYLGRINVQSEEWASSRIGRAAREAVDGVTGKITALFPQVGVVKLALPDGSIFIDLDKFSGIKVGDVLVLKRVQKILDPDTGEVVFEENKELGKVKVTEVTEKGSKCAADGKLAEAAKKGDIVLVQKK
jgi:curli biogenesis system outer membrane secretion channel CsgG